MATPLKAAVQTVEGDWIKVALEDGQTLRIPASACEGTPKPGADVRLIAAVLGSEDAGRQALAHHILNQLLGTKSE
ncbi:MAG TPA: hypothetical protein VN397_00180 [Candidatus Methylomirabilis sp.]|nr:hypothetical protein [Candidatus Methylomirabilis sp.]